MESTNLASSRRPLLELTSFTLHILGMIFMLCDHLWATLIPGNEWLTCVGRLTFPIFAFMTVEGYFHTKDFKKYLKRMLFFAILSEIPFNLTYSGMWFYPIHQNVLWTFILALLCMRTIDNVKKKHQSWKAILFIALYIGLFCLASLLTMVDYYHYGLLTVLVFYFFRGSKWWQRLGQLAGMVWINGYMVKGLTYSFTLFGLDFNIGQQVFAIPAILLIWCYHGKQGLHNKFIQYLFYAFYPGHLLILGIINLLK